MSAAMVTIDVKDVKRLSDKLKSCALSSSDRINLMGSLGLEIEEQTKDRFVHTRTAPDGSPWKEISEVTRQYLKNGEGSTLYREGGLFRSIERQVESEWSVIVGAASEYAATHQFGAKQGEFGRSKNNGPIPWGDIPARPYLGLSPDDIDELEDMAEDWLRRHIA